MIQKSSKSTGKKLQERQSQTARFLVLYPFSEGGRLLGSFLDLLLRQTSVKIELIRVCTMQNFTCIVFYYRLVTIVFCRLSRAPAKPFLAPRSQLPRYTQEALWSAKHSPNVNRTMANHGSLSNRKVFRGRNRPGVMKAPRNPPFGARHEQ